MSCTGTVTLVGPFDSNRVSVTSCSTPAEVSADTLTTDGVIVTVEVENVNREDAVTGIVGSLGGYDFAMDGTVTVPGRGSQQVEVRVGPLTTDQLDLITLEGENAVGAETSSPSMA